MSVRLAVVVGVGLLVVAGGARAQKFEELARTPPMGWNSWNHFGCDVTESLIRETADAMVETGMREAGYEYVNIDDCWHGRRDSLGFIRADPERFPSGIAALAEYVHARGLKLGIYSDAGWRTCAGRPGSRGYEYQDALTYAQWGVDYLKYDWCNTEKLDPEGAYQTMSAAIRAAGRPMILSITEWGTHDPWLWGAGYGHLWRTTGDITNCWDCVVDHGTWKSWGVLPILDRQDGLRVHAGPGHWNDPDMLEVGNGMTVAQDRSHFTMWAMLAAPLLAGNDLRTMSQETRAILTNEAVIAVNQDSLGIQGYPYRSADEVQVWLKPLSRGAWAVAVLNRGDVPRSVRLDWAEEDVRDDFSQRDAAFDRTVYLLHDLWADRPVGRTTEPLEATVPPHDVLLLRAEPLATSDGGP